MDRLVVTFDELLENDNFENGLQWCTVALRTDSLDNSVAL